MITLVADEVWSEILQVKKLVILNLRNYAYPPLGYPRSFSADEPKEVYKPFKPGAIHLAVKQP